MDDASAATRYHLDSSVQRHGRVLIGGSPLKLFRVTEAGDAVVDRIAAGDMVAPSTLIASLLDAGAIHPVHDAGAFTAADVTVVMPCRGRRPLAPEGALVVDDGSPEPIAGAALRFEASRGPAAARNGGLALVTTPLVAFVDADVELPDGWLGALLPHFTDALVALVAPRVRSRAPETPSSPSRSRSSSIADYEREHSPLDLGPEPARIRAGTRVSYVPTAALVCRVDALRSVGGFDVALRFGEDVDLVWRLDEAGWRCRYEPAAEVLHDPRPTWASWARQRIDYGSSAAPLAVRHAGALAPIRMSGWSVAAWTLAAVGRPVVGALVGAGSAAALVRKLPDVPRLAAFRLAWLGNVHAGDQLATAVRRVWWPLLTIAAIRTRVARSILVAAMLAARRPLRLADDLAYSIGIWRGMLVEPTVAPLVPRLSSWPGRRAPAPPS